MRRHLIRLVRACGHDEKKLPMARRAIGSAGGLPLGFKSEETFETYPRIFLERGNQGRLKRALGVRR